MAATIIFGIFLILHGRVHLLYWGQSARKFELQSGLSWPDGSWLFKRMLPAETVRQTAGGACILAALSFIAGAAGVLATRGWWPSAVIGAAAFSIALFVLFWNGKLQRLADNGLFALLLNIAVIIVAVIRPGLN